MLINLNDKTVTRKMKQLLLLTIKTIIKKIIITLSLLVNILLLITTVCYYCMKPHQKQNDVLHY